MVSQQKITIYGEIYIEEGVAISRVVRLYKN